ncbi:MAG: sulfatase-like hydrolase/transferase [Lacibacter sp.]
MKVLIRRILRFTLFWLLFFALCRFVFLLSVKPKWEGEGIVSTLKSFLVGLPMDLSATAYIGSIPLFVLMVAFLIGKIPEWQKLYRFYMIAMICLISVISVIDFNLYREWGSKLGYRAVMLTIDSPRNSFISSLSSPVFISLGALVILIFAGVFFFRRWELPLKSITYPSFIARIMLVLVMGGVFIIAGRGGISNSPITISSAYYSSNQTLNHIAINASWNFVRDIIDQNELINKTYEMLPAAEASAVCDSLFQSRDSVVSILKTNRPNIVLIILESFTADLIEELGGEKDVTPFFSSLAKGGLLFTNLHATGFRTDIGFTSVITGFPSLATKSIITIPEKANKLPALSSSLYKNGYHTSFYYGGETDFFNLRSFVLQKNFERLVDIRNFKKNEIGSKWGVFDHIVFERVLGDLKKDSLPFFTTVLTLSNHEPFDLPSEAKFPGEDVPNKFRSTAYYTDQSLKSFFESASRESWYNNTLFILVADHGHRLPKNENEVHEPGRSHIPLLFAGNVLKDEFKGKQMNQIASQVDLPASVLQQLGITADEYKWSKNLFNPFEKQFAFYSYDNGFTWMDENGNIAFDNNGKQIIYQSRGNQSAGNMKRLGLAFQQQVYARFLSY